MRRVLQSRLVLLRSFLPSLAIPIRVRIGCRLRNRVAGATPKRLSEERLPYRNSETQISDGYVHSRTRRGVPPGFCPTAAGRFDFPDARWVAELARLSRRSACCPNPGRVPRPMPSEQLERNGVLELRIEEQPLQSSQGEQPSSWNFNHQDVGSIMASLPGSMGDNRHPSVQQKFVSASCFSDTFLDVTVPLRFAQQALMPLRERIPAP